MTHSQLIENLVSSCSDNIGENTTFVECGSGRTTVTFGKLARQLGASMYSCDRNRQKIDELRSQFPRELEHVQFLVGNSLDSARTIVTTVDSIEVLFLDSAPSAFHTMKEFLVFEGRLKPGSLLIIDNACLPSDKNPRSPCRKGKVLVPYLLASPYWRTQSHPEAGDSMFSAILHSEPLFIEREYEFPGLRYED